MKHLAVVLVLLLAVVSTGPGKSIAPPTVEGTDTVYHFRPNGAGYTAANPAQDLSVVVRANSLTIMTANETWQLHSDLPAVAITRAGNRLTVHRAGYDEWYINGPLGLQQGFTVYAPSEIAFDVGGTLATNASIQSLNLGDVLTFSGLMAFDAQGKDVPVQFKLENTRLVYTYDDTNARYPLTIDPWVQQARLTALDAAGGDEFGRGVALDGDTAVVGAPRDECVAGADCGSAYVFTRIGSTWVQQAKLVASDGGADDRFGTAVSINRDTAIVGAFLDECLAGADCGSAYVFTRSGSMWSQQAKLTANDAAANDFFGIAVAVDGNTALVGAQGDDCMAGTSCGAAYIFTRNGSTWTQQIKLTANDAANDLFGASVALDGSTALIGAYANACPAGGNCGSAYVFTGSGSVWTQQANLTASDANTGDLFGVSVAVDANTAVVGARLDDCAAGGVDCGSTYVFTRSGTAWSQQAKLTASDGVASDNFGTSVGLAGNIAVVGAEWDNCPGGGFCGSAYVFSRSGSTWTQQAKLTANDAAGGDLFGVSVALSGTTALVGAWRDDCPGEVDCGSAYIFGIPKVTLSLEPDIVPETAGSLTLTASLDTPSTFVITVSLLFSGTATANQDYTVTSTSISIPAGQPSGSTTLNILNDNIYEDMESIIIDVNTVSNALEDGQQQEVVFIQDNETEPLVGIGPAMQSVAEGNNGTTTVNFTVNMSHPSSNTAIVAYTVNDGTATTADDDYVDADGWVSFAPGETSQPISVEVVGDIAFESDEDFTVTLDVFVAPTLQHGQFLPIIDPAADTATVTILNDDNNTTLAASAVCNGPDLEVNISSGNGPFDITASAGINMPVNGVSVGTSIITGPEKWDDVTVTETSGDLESVNLGTFKCRSDERPTPLTPAHQAHISDTTPTFTWTAVTDANNYRLFLFDDPVVANRTVDIRENSGGTTSHILTQSLPVGRVFWRVRARTNRVWGLWSVRFTLFIDAPPMLNNPAPVPTIGLNPPPGETSPTLPAPPNSR
ncbi:MAG: hypothetical protein L0154_25240 [Chloroflexi bacterium]|nr:hypothetical protein [Chloroflexota bacterium]